MNAEKKVEILLAEYNTLRAESLEAIKNKFQVVAFGFAGLSVFVGSTLSSDIGLAPSVLIFFLVIPTLSKAIMIIWLGEHRRMVRAGGGVAALEIEINRLAGETLLAWEKWVRTESSAMRLPYRVTIGMFQFASSASVAIGALVVLRVLVENGTRPALVALAVAGLVLVAALEIGLHVLVDRRWRAAVGVADVAEQRLKVAHP